MTLVHCETQTSLWTTLNTLPCFKSSPLSDDAPQSLTWQYILPPNPLVPADPPNISSFRTLKAALPAPAPEHRYQHTLQSLIDLTGYLTTQAYGSTTSFRPFGASQLGPREEEIRREIRALKGLVLNRCATIPPDWTPLLIVSLLSGVPSFPQVAVPRR